MQTDPVLRLLERAAPLRDEHLATAQAVDAVGDLARSLALAEEQAPARRPRRGRHSRRFLVVALALILLATAGTALGIGYVLTAHTGWFGNPEHTEEDGSEWLDMTAPDFRAVAATLVPDVPLPEGVSWDGELDRLAAWGRAENAMMQETGVTARLAAFARCAWLQHWRTEHTAGRDGSAREALAVLDASASWPIVVATDGGGVVEHDREVNRAADRGDVAAVDYELALNCTGFDLSGAR
jgi:hypothetical protein